jgi:CRP-like cAMP-binding protein
MVVTSNHTDDYFDFVYRCITRFMRISRAEFQLFVPYLELRNFEKKDVILQAKEMENYLSVVIKGLVRKYITVSKKEITLQLATEGHLVQSEVSFLTRTPSEMIVEAIEPTLLVSMSFEHVQKALKELPRADEMGRLILTYMFIKKDARYYTQVKKTTRERFLEYANQHPHMLQRVPQKILASYLNIKPETFSRLKHLMYKKAN